MHDISVQVIDCVDYSTMNFSEAITELDRLEDFYIRTLCTAFPLGLNDKVSGVGSVKQVGLNSTLYFGKPIPRRPRGHGRRRNRTNKVRENDFTLESIICQLITLFLAGKFKGSLLLIKLIK